MPSPVLLWAMNRDGYGRLCRLLTRGRRQAPKGECRLAFADVAEHASGLLARRIAPACSDDGPSELLEWREVFADRTYAVAELHRGPVRSHGGWPSGNARPRPRGVPLVAAGDVHYHDARRRYLQDVLTAIRLKTTVAELGRPAFPTANDG